MKFLHLLKLLRWPNLVLLLLTQYSLWVVLSDIPLQTWALLAGGTLLITGAGYIINDFYDLDIDGINKPQKQILGKQISQELALGIYGSLNTLALFLGFYIQNIAILGLFALAIFLLWFYSAFLKKIALVGNLTIAILVALSLWEMLYLESNKISIENQHLYWAYIYFSFWTTLGREITKDIEDMEGDAKAGAKTLPIVLGQSKALYFIWGVLLFIQVYLLLFIQWVWEDMNAVRFLYWLVALSLPLFLLAVQLVGAAQKKDFSKLSLLWKGYMFLGLLWLWVWKLY